MEDQIYHYHAEMCKVLSHPKRLELIDLLRDGEMNVSDLCQALGLSPGNLSQHLAMMPGLGVLSKKKCTESSLKAVGTLLVLPPPKISSSPSS